MENIRIRIIMENGQEMEAELYPDIAPETVANFTELIRQKFFDGIIFHRVIKGFMIQGGDPTGTGMGGSEKNIKGEFLSNGFVNELKHTRGVLSMARTMDPNSSSCMKMPRTLMANMPPSARSLKALKQLMRSPL